VLVAQRPAENIPMCIQQNQDRNKFNNIQKLYRNGKGMEQRDQQLLTVNGQVLKVG
jgi:hypothetical protein